MCSHFANKREIRKLGEYQQHGVNSYFQHPSQTKPLPLQLGGVPLSDTAQDKAEEGS